MLHIDTKKFIDTITSPDINFIVPIIVFLEVGNVLQRISPQFKNEDLIRFFEDHTVINLDLEFAKQLLVIFKGLKLRTSDAIIAACSKLADATLITWDEKFKKSAEKFVTVKTPKEL